MSDYLDLIKEQNNLLAKQTAAIRQQTEENQRIAASARAEARKTQEIITESTIDTDQATRRGRNFIYSGAKFGDVNWGHNSNWNDITITLKENGSFDWTWTLQYRTDRLNSAFEDGLSECMYGLKSPGYTHMKTNAYNAGYALMENFYIPSGIIIGDHSINSKTYYSWIKRSIDTNTGLVTYNWSHPFQNEGLNQAFADGVNARIKELNENSDENVATRMETEVPVLLATRHQEHQNLIKEISEVKLARTLTFIGIIGFIITIISLWNTDHGFIAFLLTLVGGWVYLMVSAGEIRLPGNELANLEDRERQYHQNT